MIIVNNIAQGTKSWFELKAGVVSSSSFSKILTNTGKLSAQAKDYMYQLAGERILGECEESYTSKAMQDGIEREAGARDLFSFITNHDVEEVGFIFKDESRKIGCSPDGIFPGSGLEIKCPKLKTHVGYLLADAMPTKYNAQVQGSMWVRGCDNWHFMSYYTGMPELITKVARDDSYIKTLAVTINEFVEQLDELTEKLRRGAL